jgi:peptidoglycan hydrolase CwlO-like protein
MKSLSALLVAIVMVMSISVLTGCKDQSEVQKTDQTQTQTPGTTELEQAQQELEKIKKDSKQLDKYINDLKTQINNLKIENQKLIAESKRMEAQIIDLKIELGQIPDTKSSEVLDKNSGKSKDGTSSDNSADQSPSPSGN